MSRSILCLFSFIFATVSSITTQASVITFESESINNASNYNSVNGGASLYSSDGHILTNTHQASAGFYVAGTSSFFYNGSTSLGNANSGGHTELTLEGGGVFDLTSIDVSGGFSEGLVHFRAEDSDGANKAMDFTMDGTSGFETVLFSGWNDLVKASWYTTDGSYLMVDNITTVSSVPVPAAVWLFGSGLVGLAGIARRKKAA